MTYRFEVCTFSELQEKYRRFVDRDQAMAEFQRLKARCPVGTEVQFCDLETGEILAFHPPLPA